MATFDIKDSASINEWKARSNSLTEESNAIMKDVEQVLEEVASKSQGGLVDQLLESSHAILEGTNALITVMNEMASFLDSFVSFFSDAADAIKDGFSKLTGIARG